MDVRSFVYPSCTLSLHKSSLQGLELQPASRHFENSGTGIKRSTVACCHRSVCGGLSPEVVGDSTLVDIQESSNGYVLFKFGTTQLYDDPHHFVSSSAQTASTTYLEGDKDAVDCSALAYRLPCGNSLIGSYPWGYQTLSLPEASSSGSHRSSIERPGPTLSSEKLCDLPLDIVGPLRFGNYIVSSEARNEALIRYGHTSSSDSTIMKQLQANLPVKDVNAELTSLGGSVHSMMSSTDRRSSERIGKRTRQKKPIRNLYKSGCFQVNELVFFYPFMDSTKAFSSLKAIPKERYTQLFSVTNQIAIGLAGSGLALVLFVASRMLCLDAALDGVKMMSLARGIGLLWLSSGLQKFGSVIELMAECAEKARAERKERLARLRKEVHSVTFKVLTMVMLSMVRLA